MYKLEEYTGKLYTKDEFISTYCAATDDDILGCVWDQLPTIDTEGYDIEELKKKLEYIYKKGEPLVVGDMVLYTDTQGGTTYGFVKETWGRLIVENTNWGMKQYMKESFEVKGEYSKIVTTSSTTTRMYTQSSPPHLSLTPPVSLVEKMKPFQMAYNVAMNALASIFRK